MSMSNGSWFIPYDFYGSKNVYKYLRLYDDEGFSCECIIPIFCNEKCKINIILHWYMIKQYIQRILYYMPTRDMYRLPHISLFSSELTKRICQITNGSVAEWSRR